MNQQEIFSKFNDVKGNIQNLLQKFRGKDKEDDFEDTENDMRFDDQGIDNYVDDLPLTINRDAGPGVKFYTTENSEAARGAEKEIPRGIDSFGERDTYSLEEADDYQTNRDRNQNSDLSQRFYTNGLDLNDLNKS